VQDVTPYCPEESLIYGRQVFPISIVENVITSTDKDDDDDGDEIIFLFKKI
jgi:hypothetical protein